MKKYLVIGAVIIFTIYMFGCRKKEVTMEESQEPMSMEALSTMSAAMPTTPEAKVSEPLPPAGPYKPTSIEIQTALKNAKFYTGEIDGKIGPISKKAIEEFQKASGLKDDGKVGPKTWAELSKYLNPAPSPATPSKKR